MSDIQADTQALAPVKPAAIPTGLPAVSTALADRAARYISAAKSDNTLINYANAWQHFEAYCTEAHYQALPASSGAVVDYITHLADDGYKASTIQAKLAAIGFKHEALGHTNPVKAPDVRTAMSGIRRTIGTAPARKAPISLNDLRKIIGALPRNLRGKRDKAMLLIGWAGAFRRSELVGLDVEDILFSDTKATITLRRSKTDQEGQGMLKVIPVLADKSLCPVTALRSWLDVADIHSGVVFRSIDRWNHVHDHRMLGREVARIVKRVANLAGFDVRQLAGHSLRSGFITQAAEDGLDTWAIAEVSGHKSQDVLRGYIRTAGRSQVKAIKTVFGESSEVDLHRSA
jgi:site-specific recombinase XerD